MEQKFFLYRWIYENPAKQVGQLEDWALQKLNLKYEQLHEILSSGIESGELVWDGQVYQISQQGLAYMGPFRVQNAIILAAGFGSRFVPLTFHTPKGLLTIRGEKMVERQIQQLLERGIDDITLVVGYLRESFEYLVGRYGVNLIYNPEYAVKNNLATLHLVRNLLGNTYILSSDNWLSENMFHSYEPYSWYSCIFMKGKTSEWCLKTQGEHQRITGVSVGGQDSLVMYGPVYFDSNFSNQFRPLLEQAYCRPGSEQNYWENVLTENLDQLTMYANPQPENQVYEVENLAELRAFDPSFCERSNDVTMQNIAELFQVSEGEIWPVKCLKSGRKEHAFSFQIRGKKYGYHCFSGLFNGHEFQQRAIILAGQLGLAPKQNWFFQRNDQQEWIYSIDWEERIPKGDWGEDLRCMHALRQLHWSGFFTEKEFSFKREIEYFWKLLPDTENRIWLESLREQFQKLGKKLEQTEPSLGMIHGSASRDAFVLGDGGKIAILGWYRAGIGDVLIDPASFAVAAGYSIQQMENILEDYLGHVPNIQEKIRFYGNAVLAGILWMLEVNYRIKLSEEVIEASVGEQLRTQIELCLKQLEN